MTKFQVGDLVKCINDNNYDLVYVDGIYKVRRVNNEGYIQLEYIYGNDNFWYDAHDFVLVEPVKPETNIIPLFPGTELKKYNTYNNSEEIITITDVSVEYNTIKNEVAANITFKNSNGLQFIFPLIQKFKGITFTKPYRYNIIKVNKDTVLEKYVEKTCNDVTETKFPVQYTNLIKIVNYGVIKREE